MLTEGPRLGWPQGERVGRVLGRGWRGSGASGAGTHPDLQAPAFALHVKHHRGALVPATHCGTGGRRGRRQAWAAGRPRSTAAVPTAVLQTPSPAACACHRHDLTCLPHDLDVAAAVGPGQRDAAPPAICHRCQLLQRGAQGGLQG
jgi:hypothetical protein